MGATNHCRRRRITVGAPKSPNNVTSTFFIAVNMLPKGLKFKHGGAKLASCPGRHLTSLSPALTATTRVDGTKALGVILGPRHAVVPNRSVWGGNVPLAFGCFSQTLLRDSDILLSIAFAWQRFTRHSVYPPLSWKHSTSTTSKCSSVHWANAKCCL